eukprot:537206_1
MGICHSSDVSVLERINASVLQQLNNQLIEDAPIDESEMDIDGSDEGDGDDVEMANGEGDGEGDGEDNEIEIVYNTPQEAIQSVVAAKSLSIEADASFVSSFETSDVQRKGRGVIHDALYRIYFNQLLSRNHNYSDTLKQAIRKVRTGASGPRKLKKKIIDLKYKLLTFNLPSIGDVQLIADDSDKLLLSDSMVMPAIKAFHVQYGCSTVNPFYDAFQDTFIIQISKDKFREKFKALKCRTCLERNLNIPGDKHTNFIFVRNKKELNQMDWYDAQKGFDDRIKNQLDKCEKKKIFSIYEPTNGDYRLSAHRSENKVETIASLDYHFTQKDGWPRKLGMDHGSACANGCAVIHCRNILNLMQTNQQSILYHYYLQCMVYNALQ